MQNPDFVHSAFSAIASRYVTTNHVLSLGIDIVWRKRVGQIVAEWGGTNLLDIATGTGDLALSLQNDVPDLEITGVDFCQAMLDVAAKRGLSRLICADAMNLPFDSESFDSATVAFGLRNMADYSLALKEFARVLKPCGHLLILDFSLPQGVLRRPYRFYLHHVLPHIAGWLTGHPEAYDYLGESIEKFPHGDEMCALLKSCGYNEIRCESLNGGIASIYVASK